MDDLDAEMDELDRLGLELDGDLVDEDAAFQDADDEGALNDTAHDDDEMARVMAELDDVLLDDEELFEGACHAPVRARTQRNCRGLGAL